ncbi:LysM peptidoglycan-binding domain-containing protein [Jannaschia formosa]|uniref:LysM peptidoglycan-binding domain-containing protein n=1 Tax=Jannaschia formosa TaxID=2259592 RepID=UPI000E1BB8E2|nr:transporter substrate-binding domain-containing protein [Jannaschia formosa]TFL19532.1 transporter substrate-binding domain-containing protein [Jannaschia formosa]
MARTRRPQPASHAVARRSPRPATGAKAALAAGVAVVLGGAMLPGSDAQAQQLCSSYVVARGDTLGQIASKARVRGGYRALFAVNTDILPSPHALEVGQVLTIPCADGSMPDPSAPVVARVPAAPAPAPVPVVAPAPEPEASEPIVFLTATGFAPFTDEDLPDGGAITRMVKRSMELADPEQEFRVVFVNDWGAHLSELLPSGAFDMGFPWSLPDCSKVELLTGGNARRCTYFDASDPFYEEGVSYYAAAGSPYADATDYAQLQGTTICRPDGWFSFDLETQGLTEPNVTMVWPGNQLDCWAMLERGEVDIITYDTQVAEEDMRTVGVGDKAVEIEALASSTTLHVFVPKDHPKGRDYLQTLNAGLEELRLSGEWFAIVREQVQATVMN